MLDRMQCAWMVAYLVLSCAVVPVRAGARCGKCWGDANANPDSCSKPCTYNAQCTEAGEVCYGGLWDAVCGIDFNDAEHSCPDIPREYFDPASATDADFTAQGLATIMGGLSGVDYSTHYGRIAEAMRDYQITTKMQKAQFLAQLAHETGGLCTMWQPVDNGSGDFHMLPTNFRAMCRRDTKLQDAFREVFCPSGNCPGDVCCLGSDFCAGKIVGSPKFAHRSAAWWLTEGSALANSQRCGDLRDAMECGDNGNGNQGFELITNCIYGFIYTAAKGVPQRRQYLKEALKVLNGQAVPSKCSNNGKYVNLGSATTACGVLTPSGGGSTPTTPSGGSSGSCKKQAGGGTRCGSGWAGANGACGCSCSGDADCPSGQNCYADLSMTPCGSQGPPPPPSPPVSSCKKQTLDDRSNRCGKSWAQANEGCGCPCGSTNADCPDGETCYGGMSKRCATNGGAGEEAAKDTSSSAGFPTGAAVGLVVCGVIVALAAVVGASVMVLRYAKDSAAGSSSDKAKGTYVKMVEAEDVETAL